ncbi:methyl-accepting chemotaxis protein [Rhizobium sp. PAMB 3174]
MKRLKFRRPGIRATLIGTIGGLAALSAVISWASTQSMETINTNSSAITQTWLPSVSVSKDLVIAAGKLRETYAAHVLAADKNAKAAAEKKVAAANAELDGLLKAYATRANDDKTAKSIDQLKSQIASYNKMGKTVLYYSGAGRDKEAKMYLGTMSNIGNTIEKIVGQLVADSENGAAATATKNQELMRTATELNYILAAIALVGALLAVIFVVKSIAAPIRRITRSMRDLANGDTASEIPFAGRSDEIGAMAGAVGVFREAAIANRRLEQEAADSRAKAEAERIEAEQQAEAAAAERLKIATSGLAEALKRLAAGDLAFQITEPFAPEFEPLRRDFNQSVQQLGRTLTDITLSISSLENGTHEIASGIDDLSKRTEHQAASLEETSAALDEITANVNNSAQRTEEARGIAAEANRSAVQSAEVVSHAEDAMRRIEEGSQQISNIIGVIDQIAFQTNLLALNAGVEAARAGDAGKGFAVVAQEVRELAQRSAQAAKEIKDLIGRSAGDVQGGVKLVRDAGQALTTIGGFIVEINSHVEAIAVSAKEQATGIVEVNAAINAMDQATQQNAAMVEQSNAASASLAGDAQRLRSLVQQFRLEDGASAQAGALRQTAATMATRSAPPAPARAPAPRPVAAARGNAAVATDSWEEF